MIPSQGGLTLSDDLRSPSSHSSSRCQRIRSSHLTSDRHFVRVTQLNIALGVVGHW